MGDAPDVDLLCRDELDVSVGASQWASGQRDLVSKHGSGLGNACQRLFSKREVIESGLVDVGALYRWSAPYSRI